MQKWRHRRIYSAKVQRWKGDESGDGCQVSGVGRVSGIRYRVPDIGKSRETGDGYKS